MNTECPTSDVEPVRRRMSDRFLPNSQANNQHPWSDQIQYQNKFNAQPPENLAFEE